MDKELLLKESAELLGGLVEKCKSQRQTISSLNEQIISMQSSAADKDSEFSKERESLNATIAELKSSLSDMESKLAEKDSLIESLKKDISEKDAAINNIHESQLRQRTIKKDSRERIIAQPDSELQGLMDEARALLK